MGHRHLGQVSSMIEHGLSYLMPTRYLNQDLSPDEIHLLVGSWSDGVPAMELPVDEEAQSGLPPPISMRTTSGISASHQPTTRLGPFCRAAEAGHLLGQVLDLIAQSSYSREMDFEKARALASHITGEMSLPKFRGAPRKDPVRCVGLSFPCAAPSKGTPSSPL